MCDWSGSPIRQQVLPLIALQHHNGIHSTLSEHRRIIDVAFSSCAHADQKAHADSAFFGKQVGHVIGHGPNSSSLQVSGARAV